jgi:hypothetical protein
MLPFLFNVKSTSNQRQIFWSYRLIGVGTFVNRNVYKKPLHNL